LKIYEFREELIHLDKDLATRTNVEESLKETLENALLIYYDHGMETCLSAQWGQDCVFDLSNASLTKSKMVYTLACLSGKSLLPRMVVEGALTAWGYDRVFGFCIGTYEKYFETQANCGLENLLDGKAFDEAKKAFFERSYEMVDELDKKGASPVADQVIWNLESLKVLGDLDTKIPIPPKKPPTPPTCPVSRAIVALFGYRTLNALRKMRNRLTSKNHLRT